MINPLKQVTDGFILTVGITPPRPKQERRAMVFITTMLAGTIAVVVAITLFAVHHL